MTVSSHSRKDVAGSASHDVGLLSCPRAKVVASNTTTPRKTTSQNTRTRTGYAAIESPAAVKRASKNVFASAKSAAGSIDIESSTSGISATTPTTFAHISP